ncbi:MAG: CvpA family protein [Bryobacterales bacterium]|nr:CvpA family protein [Bryobacterales bacterium]
MNWIDLVLGFILVISFFQGVIRGFSRVAIAFAGTLVGLFLAAWFYSSAAAVLAPYLSSGTLAKFLGFVLIFIGVQLLAALIAWVVQKIFKISGLSWLDRLMGAAFGLLRGMVLCTILLLAVMAFPFKPVADVVAKSEIAPYVIGIANAAAAVTPKELKDGFYATYDRVKQLWESTTAKPPEKSTS